MIPIDRITVLNPRERNKRVFGDIVTNIAHLGLNRPITVTRRDKGEGSEHYDLVCGQGRLEAYRALGQVEIPAVVIDASEEDCLVMSWWRTSLGASTSRSSWYRRSATFAGVAIRAWSVSPTRP